jgi:glycosyltransferase involved in cell wall biosynthesis
LESRAEQLGLADVTFDGYQQPARLRKIVGEARFVIVPSEWYENYPFAILEAFALGRPVVGTRIGGIPELVCPGETGNLAEPGNPDSLAAEIADVAADPARADAMGRAARDWVERELAPGPHLDKLNAIYEGLVR